MSLGQGRHSLERGLYSAQGYRDSVWPAEESARTYDQSIDHRLEALEEDAEEEGGPAAAGAAGAATAAGAAAATSRYPL